MSYYLRVEGMNLGNFVMETSDLATVRGGSLLLLEAMDQVEEKIKGQIPDVDVDQLIKDNVTKLQTAKQELKRLTGEEKKKKNEEVAKLRAKKKRLKNLKKTGAANTPTITKGASWGLFELNNINHATALAIQNNIIDFFNQDDQYKHATFMVDIYQKTEKESYQEARDKVQTLNRWQQLQAPSVAITREGDGVCAVDRLRPAAKKNNLSWKDDRVSASASVKARRDYGVQEKTTSGFYKKRELIDDDSDLKFSHDLKRLSGNPPEYASALKGKIAFIYLDGNEFGRMQKDSQNPDEQRAFDSQTREGKKQVLRTIIDEIKDRADWLDADGRLRLETLLWGGDEIIWGVPAWHGWWLLDKFYQLAKKHICLRSGGSTTQLFHGAGLVFCHHNAPIQRIDSLARSLADGFAKQKNYKESNKIAYQVLESFDHIGTNLAAFRQERIRGLAGNIDHLLLDADDMGTIAAIIGQLKKNDFPKRKLYQIVHAFRRGDGDKVAKLHKKLIGTNITGRATTKEQQVYAKELEKVKEMFSGSNVFWLHLLELWDFIGLDQPGQNSGEV